MVSISFDILFNFQLKYCAKSSWLKPLEYSGIAGCGHPINAPGHCLWGSPTHFAKTFKQNKSICLKTRFFWEWQKSLSAWDMRTFVFLGSRLV